MYHFTLTSKGKYLVHVNDNTKGIKTLDENYTHTHPDVLSCEEELSDFLHNYIYDLLIPSLALDSNNNIVMALPTTAEISIAIITFLSLSKEDRVKKINKLKASNNKVKSRNTIYSKLSNLSTLNTIDSDITNAKAHLESLEALKEKLTPIEL